MVATVVVALCRCRGSAKGLGDSASGLTLDELAEVLNIVVTSLQLGFCRGVIDANEHSLACEKAERGQRRREQGQRRRERGDRLTHALHSCWSTQRRGLRGRSRGRACWRISRACHGQRKRARVLREGRDSSRLTPESWRTGSESRRTAAESGRTAAGRRSRG